MQVACGLPVSVAQVCLEAEISLHIDIDLAIDL